MDREQLLGKALDKMKAAGFERVQLELTNSEKHELNQQHGEINLLRTGFNARLELTGIRDKRQASLSINQLDDEALNEAIEDLLAMCNGSPQDEAYDIAPHQSAAKFNLGPEQADSELMYDRLAGFIEYCTSHHPAIILEEALVDFNYLQHRVVNSNGVDFAVNSGLYSASAMFTAKEAEHTSSFNYSGYSRQQLSREIHEEAYLAELLYQSEQQLHCQQIPAKFEGELVITPHALAEEFLDFLTFQLSDAAMIAGTSLYQGKVGQGVCSPLVNLYSRPCDPLLASRYPLTADGILADNTTLLEQGNLNGYLLSQYGANKTGLPRALNDGDALIMEAGTTALDDMIADIEQGILLCRFSGGDPNDKGDFSGVAKNSYYIKDGKIQYPVNETMISGNMAQLLKNINAVSSESIDFGDSILPWVRVPGVVVS